MRHPPHYLRFARSLALVGALGLASCSDDDKPGNTSDAADTLTETVQPDTSPDVAPDTTADTSPDVAPDTTADTTPGDTTEDAVADTTPETTEDTIADVEDTAVDCDACVCGSADASEACISACCIAIGPLYPPDLPA